MSPNAPVSTSPRCPTCQQELEINCQWQACATHCGPEAGHTAAVAFFAAQGWIIPGSVDGLPAYTLPCPVCG